MPVDDEMTEDNLPLHGVRVLELMQFLPGPACGVMLADMGAEVYKAEKYPLEKVNEAVHVTDGRHGGLTNIVVTP